MISNQHRAMIRRLYDLPRGGSVVYHNSSIRTKPTAVFRVARELNDIGRIQIAQKRNDDGTMDYMATGKWSDLDKKRNGE